jgi:molecular chaperone DnaJ
MTTTKKRDYYEILGVSRDADEAEIRRAYRAHAREDHPDVAEAYATLSNPERRLLYDRFGFRGGGFEDETEGFDEEEGGSGADVVTAVDVGFYEAQRGTTRKIRIDGEALCGRCAGEGGTTEACAACDGTGSVRSVSEREVARLLQVETCETCGGAGFVLVDECSRCSGSGRVPTSRTVRVRIPGGVEDGQTVRVRGEGNPSADGDTRGDALIVLRVADPPPQRPLVRIVALVLLLAAIALLVYVALK